MSFLELQNEALKGIFWLNKCCRSGNSCGDFPGSTGILERARIHALVDAKSKKFLVYTPPRQLIIPPRRKSQRNRILATSCAR